MKQVEIKTKNVTVKVVGDSIYNNNRLTTLECDYPRYVHAHLMTHRMLSKNAQSSRAVPTWTWIKQLYTNPVYPMFNKNQKGMQGGDDFTGFRLWLAMFIWNTSKTFAVGFALCLHWIGVHKQVTNRILEPYQKYVWLSVRPNGLISLSYVVTKMLNLKFVNWLNVLGERLMKAHLKKHYCIYLILKAEMQLMSIQILFIQWLDALKCLIAKIRCQKKVLSAYSKN